METEKQQQQQPKPLSRSKTVWSTLAAVLVAVLSQYLELPEEAQKHVYALVIILVGAAQISQRDAIKKSGLLAFFLACLLLTGCQSPKMDSVKQCLSRLQADYEDKTIVKVPDERVRASRLAMIRAAKEVVEEASK